jgi:hypothetical protein
MPEMPGTDEGGQRMKVLFACEESQAGCKAFRELGHEAYSCDIERCSGGHPEWHIWGDTIRLLNGNCRFMTMDRKYHSIEGKWDMIIAFPPCTHLAVSGARHFEKKRNDGRQREAIEFFLKFLTADCDRIAIENPINIISGDYIRKWFPDIVKEYALPRKPNQIIQPWQFGHGETKATCLWLKNLPNLIPTDIVEGREQRIWRMPPSPERAKIRSKTFPGIAKAMAEQWGGEAQMTNKLILSYREWKQVMEDSKDEK